MKKIIFVIAILIPISNFGQSILEIYGGYNYSTFFNKNSYDLQPKYKSNSTFLTGIYLKDRTFKHFNLCLALDYVYRSTQFEATYGGISYTTNRNIDLGLGTINLRLLPEFSVGNRYIIYLNLGPYFGWIVHSYYHDVGSTFYSFSNYISNWDESGSAKEEFKGLDFGFSTTIGIEIPISFRTKIVIDGNYSYGINNLTDGQLGSVLKMNSKNLYFTLGLAYKLENVRIVKNIFKL